MRPAFYALPGGSWRDYITLLHPPFTLWHLSYLVLGASAAPVVHLDRLGWAALAFFLAVGIAAHCLDELHSRPLGTQIPGRTLGILSTISILGAVSIGIGGSLLVSLWAVPLVFFGTFMLLAYNLELWKGWFHSDIWFAILWGGFPALVGYWANAQTIGTAGILVTVSCIVLSLAQRTLSNQVRGLRRKAVTVTGRIEYQDGHSNTITVSNLISAPEKALTLLSLSLPVLALGWLVARL